MSTSSNTVVARVYIVRHGETDHNREGIIQGHLDTPLNATGIEQARLAADALEAVPFSVAYSSDLQRARKTAEIILEKHPGLELETVQELRERFMGDWQGGSAANRPAPPPNLEPVIELTTRATKWWNEGVLRHAQRRASQLQSQSKAASGGNDAATRGGGDGDGEDAVTTGSEFEPVHILAVSHGGLIGTLLTNLIGSRKLRAGKGVEVGQCFNASISVAEVYEDGKGVLVSYADTTHLNMDLVQDNADVR